MVASIEANWPTGTVMHSSSPPGPRDGPNVLVSNSFIVVIESPENVRSNSRV